MASAGRNIIVVGASAGGVAALQRLLGGLPPDLPAAIFIVVHIGAGTDGALAEVLQRSSSLPVAKAENGAAIENGKVYVAPNDCHLFVEQDRIAVLMGPKENRTRPAINPLFRSAATAYRNRVIGVILTGMLDDGVAGLWAIKQCGGVAVVQSDAEFSAMPQNAMENVAVDHHVPLAQIPPLLSRLAREKMVSPPAAPIPEVVRVGDDSVKMRETGFPLEHAGRRTVLSCPECNGALWEMKDGAPEYRCHVGHAYAPETLRAAQEENIEQSLWTALRALKESAALDQRLADRAAENDLPAAAETHRVNAQSKLAKAEQLQRFFTQLLAENPGECRR